MSETLYVKREKENERERKRQRKGREMERMSMRVCNRFTQRKRRSGKQKMKRSRSNTPCEQQLLIIHESKSDLVKRFLQAVQQLRDNKKILWKNYSKYTQIR